MSSYSRWGALVVLLMTLICVAPLLIFEHLPNQDGGAHIDAANVALRVAADDGSLAAESALVEFKTATNQATLWLFTELVQTMSPSETIKATYAIYLGLTAASLVLIFALFGDRAVLFTALLTPFIYGRVLHYGFFNHAFGAAIALAALALMMKFYQTRSRLCLIAASALLAACFYAHVFVAAAAVLLITIFFSADALLTLWRERSQGFVDALSLAISRALGPALACVPAVALILMFLGSGAGHDSELIHNLTRKTLQLATLGLLSFSAVNLAMCLALAAVIGLATIATLASRHATPLEAPTTFLVAIMLATIVYFIIPDFYGTLTFFDLRFAPFVALLALMALLVAPPPAATRGWLLAAAVLVNLGFAGDRFWNYARINDEKRPLQTVAEAITPGSSLLFLEFGSIRDHSASGGVADLLNRQQRFEPHVHNYGFFSDLKDVLNISNYQLHPSLPYFPVKFDCPAPCGISYPGELAPLFVSGDHEAMRGEIDAIGEALGRPLDYVVTHRLRLTSEVAAAYQAGVEGVLEREYDRVLATPEGQYEVWRRKPDA